MQNLPGRELISLNGTWNYIVDPYENGYYNYRYEPFDQQLRPEQSGGYFADLKPSSISDRIEYDFDRSEQMLVPGDWNSQAERLYYYEGTIWYRKIFTSPEKAPGERIFLHIGAANYHAEVYLNGRKLGQHKGGFTPFEFEITKAMRDGDNSLVIKVDNKRHQDEVPTVNTDWWNFGGITRDVVLVKVPPTFIRDYFIQLEKGSSRKIGGYIKLDGEDAAGGQVTLEIPKLRIKEDYTADEQGFIPVDVKPRRIKAWSPESPTLYEVRLTRGNRTLVDQIGFRTIETKGQDIMLNGEPVFLKGISIHEENPLRGGRAYSKDDARLLLGWARDLGCNYVRLAHYPHNEHMVRLADELGLLVWEENPVYWTISWDNPKTYATAEKQMGELIARDKNRASVIIWSMANETPVSQARMKFLTDLRTFTLSLDDTRLISAALEVHGSGPQGLIRSISDPFAEFVDILSFNQYVGWYDGLPDKCQLIQWDIKQDKPVLVSEFGGGALQGLRGERLERWTEDYQAYLYRESLKMLDKIPQLRGMTPWILTDFHSPRRVLPTIQDDWNRKGLISSKGQKKQAYWILQDYYRTGRLPTEVDK